MHSLTVLGTRNLKTKCCVSWLLLGLLRAHPSHFLDARICCPQLVFPGVYTQHSTLSLSTLLGASLWMLLCFRRVLITLGSGILTALRIYTILYLLLVRIQIA